MREIHATKQDLVRWAKDLPIEQIKLDHISITKATLLQIQQADLVTITIGDQQKVLKDRFEAFAEVS